MSKVEMDDLANLAEKAAKKGWIITQKMNINLNGLPLFKCTGLKGLWLHSELHDYFRTVDILEKMQ